MASEKRLIDADKLLEIYKKWIPQLLSEEDEGDRHGVETCIAVLEDMPNVDAVKVVRCEKCRKRHTWECAMHYESEDGEEQYGWENDNDFCSWGERKDGDGNG